MDISDTLAPNGEQLDAIELLGHPRTFTIERVSKGNAEQPVQVHLAGFPRPWRPGKSMRRVLAACWGTQATEWVGRRVTLYCDESVRFGSEVVGGTRISHLSHIDKPKKVPLLVSRGRSATYIVQPFNDDDYVRMLREEWTRANPERRKVIEAEVARLTSGTPPETPEPDWYRDTPESRALLERERAEVAKSEKRYDGLDEFHPDTTSNPSPLLADGQDEPLPLDGAG